VSVPRGYHIADEPVAGRLGALAVNPLWPLLAGMVGGFWVAYPWFAVNAFALGSATRRRELAWLAGGLLVSAACGAAILLAAGTVPRTALRYAFIVVVGWRIGVSYAVYTLQSASFELHTHFGGAARSGVALVLAAALVPLQSLVGEKASWLVLVLVG
jgi:hypothetical protein